MVESCISLIKCHNRYGSLFISSVLVRFSMFYFIFFFIMILVFFFFQAEDGIRDYKVTGVQTCALPILKEMRDRGNMTPVLILTALGAIEDRVRGLDCGADDYLVKPFAMQELIARLRALLRRPGAALGRTLTLGSVKLDTSARIATVAETQLDLTRSELIVLEALLRNQGRVVSKERLAECLYDFEQERSANSVETQVHRLRKKLAAAGADVSLRTLRGLGYLAS